MTFEFATMSLRAAYLTTDEDVFQALEKDPEVKRRFEEASANELQMGWDRKKKDEEEMVRGVVEKVVEREQERREREVGEMLRNRGREEEGDLSVVGGKDGGDINKVLSRGFGDVKVH
jgi:phospholipid-translocating ATPase